MILLSELMLSFPQCWHTQRVEYKHQFSPVLKKQQTLVCPSHSAQALCLFFCCQVCLFVGPEIWGKGGLVNTDGWFAKSCMFAEL